MGRESKTILAVNGSASSLFSLVMLLRRLEYRVVTARSGREAVPALEKSSPSVVITDSCLPDMDGAGLLKVMRDDARFRQVPVIVLMSREDLAEKAACERLGCAACLPGSCEPDELYRIVQSLSETAPRRHRRLTTSVRVVVGDGTVMGGTERTEQATAISAGGLYVRTRYSQPQNAVTPVRISLGQHEVRAKAVVLYASEEGMGMKFTEISTGDRELIRQFIKAQITKDIAR